MWGCYWALGVPLINSFQCPVPWGEGVNVSICGASIMVCIYSKTLVCEHNSFWKHACNPKHLYIKANFPIRKNGNADDSSQTQKYSSKNDYNTVIWYKIIKKIQNMKKNKLTYTYLWKPLWLVWGRQEGGGLLSRMIFTITNRCWLQYSMNQLLSYLYLMWLVIRLLRKGSLSGSSLT